MNNLNDVCFKAYHSKKIGLIGLLLDQEIRATTDGVNRYGTGRTRSKQMLLFMYYIVLEMKMSERIITVFADG